MTAIVAWIRSLGGNVDELCIAADSRLSGDGKNIDGCPKILPLPRGDIALCFAGETELAYPFLQQLYHTALSHRSARTRGLDITKYKSHIINILNDIVSRIDTSLLRGNRKTIQEARIPKVTFLLCGYSWIEKGFKIWTICYREELKKFHSEHAGSICGRKRSIAYGGDQAAALKRATGNLLRSRRGYKFGTDPLNFEPIEALATLLEQSGADSTIGGPPQLIKLYQHLNTDIIPVYWPRGQRQKAAYLGRPLLDYERIDDWVLDLLTLDRHPLSPGTRVTPSQGSVPAP